MNKPRLHPAIPAMFLALTLSGCGSILKALVGYHNVNSYEFAKRCEMDSAMTELALGAGHASPVTRSHGLILEILYLEDMGRMEEAKALYGPLVRKSVFIKNEKKAEKELKKARRDLGKARKKYGFTEDCSGS
jgi:hypothetical protein